MANRNQIIFAVIITVYQMFLGTVFAIAVSNKRVKGRKFLRVAYFIPVVLSNLNQIINEEGRQVVEVENKIKTELNQEVLIFEEIHSIVYITKDGQMYATDVKLFDYEEDIKNSSYLANSVENSISSYFLFDSTKHLLRENAKQQELEEQWLAGTNLSSSTQMIKKEGKRYLLATNEVEGYGWTILGITDLNKFGLSSSEIGII